MIVKEICLTLDEVDYLRSILYATRNCRMHRNSLDDSKIIKSIEDKLNGISDNED